jgi:hypothetical protein
MPTPKNKNDTIKQVKPRPTPNPTATPTPRRVDMSRTRARKMGHAPWTNKAAQPKVKAKGLSPRAKKDVVRKQSDKRRFEYDADLIAAKVRPGTRQKKRKPRPEELGPRPTGQKRYQIFSVPRYQRFPRDARISSTHPGVSDAGALPKDKLQPPGPPSQKQIRKQVLDGMKRRR